MLFKGKFYFDKETNKKAVGSVGHVRTLCLIKGPCYSKVSFILIKKRTRKLYEASVTFGPFANYFVVHNMIVDLISE